MLYTTVFSNSQVLYFSEVENSFFERVLNILLDSDEAAVVRENAAQLLANLAGLSTVLGTDKNIPANVGVLKKVVVVNILLTNFPNYFYFSEFYFEVIQLYRRL